MNDETLIAVPSTAFFSLSSLLVLQASPKSANELFYGNLLQRRIVVANGRVDDTMANDLMLQFLYLEGQDPDKPITM